ncbi:laccase-7-like [Phoenix dactylifera]|uniref:Laccase n=1 Tax=Phoenix dactylifera TaxID=42345 RepID=A0A8B7D1Z0_PHODC|nr:laccase-7-like [Phoenix dactylifera]
MAQCVPILVFVVAFLRFMADAAVVEHTFRVGNLTVRRLCENRVITAVNGRLPGPTIEVHEGDTLVVHLINDSPYNLTIHWHGIFQLLSGWADGPSMITQCPIQPRNCYAYRFNITGQEGTLWWHAHSSVLRATVYGALIIRPRNGTEAFPFSKPDKEVPILLGEWWNDDIVDMDSQAFLTGGAPGDSDAYTINGKPGDLYRCSSNQMYKLEVEQGKSYLLRIINAALSKELFFKVAGHSFTVVAVDASYTKPYETDVVVIAPGQTADALMVADAPPAASYYMAALPYISTAPSPPPRPSFDNTTTRGIVRYEPAMPSAASSRPVMPAMPSFFDNDVAHRFFTSLTGLLRPGDPTVPLHVDEHMVVTFGLGVAACEASQLLCNRSRGATAASMNNVSFQFPTKKSLLEAHFRGEKGIYTSDFPDTPPVFFDFTNPAVNVNPALQSLWFTTKGTKVKKVKYNAAVEMVLQNTAILGIENHPLHLHGFNFFVLAQGFGNYNATSAVKSYNLADPPARNTIAVPTGGWAVIRFTANNPGVWIMHCHLDAHLSSGLAMAFEVENGSTPETTLPPPPPDYPRC